LGAERPSHGEPGDIGQADIDHEQVKHPVESGEGDCRRGGVRCGTGVTGLPEHAADHPTSPRVVVHHQDVEGHTYKVQASEPERKRNSMAREAE
jgi:hypothetical protein